jgi:hypothetical protein
VELSVIINIFLFNWTIEVLKNNSIYIYIYIPYTIILLHISAFWPSSSIKIIYIHLQLICCFSLHQPIFLFVNNFLVVMYYPGIRLEELRKTMKDLGQIIHCSKALLLHKSAWSCPRI